MTPIHKYLCSVTIKLCSMNAIFGPKIHYFSL
jgi:hypothetical protein